MTTTITALPSAPSRSTDTPENYVTKADAMMAALPTFITETNTVAGEINSTAAGTALAISYTFSTTTTDSDPGSGTLRLDNSTQNTATTIRADLLDSLAVDWTSVLNTFDDSSSTIKGQLRLVKVNDGTKWLAFNVTALASPTGYKNITVANIGSSAASPFANGDSIVLQFARTGDIGATGPAGTLSGAVSGNITGGDYSLSAMMLKDMGLIFLDKGNSGTSTQTLDYTAASHQKITATGNHTIATSNWPPTGNTGIILLEAVNFGAYTITWPTINWVKPDGSTTTSASTWLAAMTGRTAFQSSGTDFIKLWTRDAGTTIYGGFAQ